MGKKEQIEAAAAIIKEALAAMDRAKAMIVDGTDASMCSAPAEKSYCWPWERDYHAQVYHGIDLIAEAAGLEVETHSSAEIGFNGKRTYKVLNIGELTLFEIG